MKTYKSLASAIREVVYEAKLHPNQQQLDVHEPEKDKLTADDFKKLRGGKKEEGKDPVIVNPKLKEEAEEMEETSVAEGTEQAKRNKTMKNMMDASRGARFKLNNPVPDAEPEHKTPQAHNKAIGRAVRNNMETTKEEAEQVDETHPTAQQVKQAIGIARDKRYAGGNMTGAAKAMRKLHPDLADHPAVAKELKKQNEEISPLTGRASKNYGMSDSLIDSVRNILNGEKSEQMDEIKLADLPIRTVKGASYGADYKDPEGADDAWERERFPKKRKSGSQGSMNRRFSTKSMTRIKGIHGDKLPTQYR